MNSIEYAVSISNPENLISAEFGVSSGGTLRTLRKILPKSHKIYGFDSFLGLPEDWENTPQKKGAFTTNGVIPDIEDVTFYDGWFDKTISRFISEVPAQPFRIVHVDCDLYSSTKTVLFGLNNFIVPSTIIVFDEWIYNHDPKCCDHEQRAFLEWAEETERQFKLVKFKDTTNCGSERKIIQII